MGLHHIWSQDLLCVIRPVRRRAMHSTIVTSYMRAINQTTEFVIFADWGPTLPRGIWGVWTWCWCWFGPRHALCIFKNATSFEKYFTMNMIIYTEGHQTLVQHNHVIHGVTRLCAVSVVVKHYTNNRCVLFLHAIQVSWSERKTKLIRYRGFFKTETEVGWL